ncbi:MAG: 30S ribosome-binding factor RbfA [Nitrospirota bacterium]|nr:30S ribosome-binding factor RbfA [Nitrospirota bacterium]
MTSEHSSDRLHKKGFRRHARVGEALREVIAMAIERYVDDRRLGLVTVTAVDAAPDLKTARVLVSVLGAPIDGALEVLNAAAPVLQREIARSLRMKQTPRITFFGDATPERADRISRLLTSSDNPEGQA